MRIARTYSFDETRVEEVDVPALREGDALVRVEACGLCGSDATRWYVDQKAPTVLGHEPAGVVVETGPGCSLEVGQRVFVHHHVSCGECHCCRRGFETNCALFRSSRLDPGGFAELVRVPRDNVERDTLVLPEQISFEQATFIEPLACSLRAVHKLGLRTGDRVLVVGLGAMGLMNAVLARHFGASCVVASELRAGRSQPDPVWGIDQVLDPRLERFPEELLAATEGHGPDHVIVGPSSAAAIQQAARVVAPGGTVCLFSPVSPDEQIALPLNRLYFGEITLVASYSCAAKETREALQLLVEGVVPVDRLVSHRLPLEQVGEGIQRTAAANDDWIRGVVLPQQLT